MNALVMPPLGLAHFHADTHSLLVSARGITLDKDGSGFTPQQPFTNLSPIGIREALRRVAGRCQLLRFEVVLGQGLVHNGQNVVGLARGIGLVYSLTTEQVVFYLRKLRPAAWRRRMAFMLIILSGGALLGQGSWGLPRVFAEFSILYRGKRLMLGASFTTTDSPTLQRLSASSAVLTRGVSLIKSPSQLGWAKCLRT